MHVLKTDRVHTLAHCDDCGSEHLAAPCGMTFAQRLRSVRLDGSVTPTRSQKNYYDDDALTGVFGNTAQEREERMMEETEGVGVANQAEIKAHTELAAAHYLDA